MRLVNAIKNGIVIDHITKGRGLRVYHELKLDTIENTTVLLMNVGSDHLNKKDIIKIDGEFELNHEILGLIDPHITVNIIEDEKVVKKIFVEVPEKVSDLIKCQNPRCISHTDDYAKPVFTLVGRNGELQYQCSYCEEITKVKFY